VDRFGDFSPVQQTKFSGTDSGSTTPKTAIKTSQRHREEQDLKRGEALEEPT
jgi:hypothetical protein